MAINIDDLNSVPARLVAQDTYRVINAVQKLPPHRQVAAVAAALVAMSDAFRLSPSDIFTPVGNIMSDPVAGARPQFKALAMYVKGEIVNDG